MSGSSNKTINISSEISPPWSNDGVGSDKKKSILLNPEYKRGSSKVTIQWEESVKGKRVEERMKLEKRSRLHALGHLMAHGPKWSYIQEFMTKLKSEESKILKNTPLSEEDSQGRASPRTIDSLVRDLWQGMLQNIVIKGEDLMLDQHTKLELLKHKIKLENDKYLKGHPELDILLSLVYRQLIRTKPGDPKVFVANYVHYLNTHREELVLNEVDVPFDQPPVEAEEPSEGMVKERQEVEAFAKQLVQKCAEIATCGSTVANVTNIIDSMLENIDTPIRSSDEGSYSSLRGAEKTVREILMSMLTSVAQARTKSADMVAEEILDSVFERVCPSASRDRESFVKLRESVESFVSSLLKTVTDKFSRQLKHREQLNRFEMSISAEGTLSNEDQDILSITSKSILKRLVPQQSGEENNNSKLTDKPTKVKFQSISLHETPSKDSVLE